MDLGQRSIVTVPKKAVAKAGKVSLKKPRHVNRRAMIVWTSANPAIRPTISLGRVSMIMFTLSGPKLEL